MDLETPYKCCKIDGYCIMIGDQVSGITINALGSGDMWGIMGEYGYQATNGDHVQWLWIKNQVRDQSTRGDQYNHWGQVPSEGTGTVMGNQETSGRSCIMIRDQATSEGAWIMIGNKVPYEGALLLGSK